MSHPLSPLRRRLALGVLAALPLSALADDAPLLNTATWWDPEESGWGIFTIDQGNVSGPGWFTYDENGDPTWFLVPGAFPQPDGSYAGSICRFTGVPYPQIAGNAADPCEVVGSATLTFQGRTRLKFDYSVDGVAQSKNLVRFNFAGSDLACRASANPSRAGASNFSDLWWGTQASDGWGIHISHVGDSLFATWYTYDLDGRAVFYIGSASRQPDGRFSGPLSIQQGGTPFDQIDGAPAAQGSQQIGSVTFSFSDGETGSFSYSIDNVSQTKPIKRFLFGGTAGVCEVVAYGSITDDDEGGGGQPGADECFPPLAVGDKYRLRDTDADGNVSHTDVEVIGTGTDPFQGRPVFKISYTPDGNANGSIIEFVEQTASERIHYGSEGWIPAAEARGQTRFDPPVRIPRSTPVGSVGTRNFKAISNYTASGQAVSITVDFVEVFERVGTETVSTPAGSFPGACRFETSLQSVVNTAQSGFNVRVETDSDVTQWAHPAIGPLRTLTDSVTSSTVTGAPVPIPPTVTSSSGTSEIVSARIGGNNYP
ncbi:MAG: hypothetical protein WCZ65_02620 [Lysobacteraceae bacterium]